MCEEVLATGPADYVSSASFTEAGAGKADDITVDVSWESVAEDGDLFSIRAASVCGGCWEVLPDICRCGAVRMCGECAEVVVAAGAVAEAVAEPGFCKADMGESGGEDGAASQGVMIDMVRLELQRMVENVERMGSLGQGLADLSGISARLDKMSQNMVPCDAYNRLFNRIRQLKWEWTL